MPARVVAHLDMDAFFASVELLRYPELRGRPVVVGGRRVEPPHRLPNGAWVYQTLRHYAGRGVITTATYEARKLGVHSAMGLMKAATLAPEAVLLPADFERYRAMSKRFKAAVASIAPIIEDRGIDEIYLDLTEHPSVADDRELVALRRAGELAVEIQAAVQRATGLSCSLGVTRNKLLAKLASDFQKPGGVTVLTAADLAQRVWPLPAARINGIGPKAANRLQRLGIHTIGELAQTSLGALQATFGLRYGAWLHAVAHGQDDSPVVTQRERKSVSRETTFDRDMHSVHDRLELGQRFTRLCQQVAADLQRLQRRGRTVGIKLRFADFHTVTRDLTLGEATDEATTIRRAAAQCLQRVNLDRRLRLLGVRVGTLEGREVTGTTNASGAGATLPLFPDLPA